MRYFLPVFLLFSACGGSDTPLTWGAVSERLGTAYCGAAVNCGFHLNNVDACVDHVAWHMCVPDGTCGVETPEAEATLEACEAALGAYDFTDEYGDECFYLGWYGVMPVECGSLWDYKPEPADAGPE